MDDFGLPISVAIFMELFCSIHMSVFVLFPLAEIINPKKKTSIFCRLFALRFVILFIGNFINPAIAMIDFFAIFIGAFIVIPVLIGLKKERGTEEEKQKVDKVDYQDKLKKKRNEYEEISEEELERIGVMDSELFRKELYNLFLKYQTAYSDLNQEMLLPLCSNHYFQTSLQKIEWLRKKKEREILENFKLNGVKIYNLTRNNYLQTVSVLFDVEHVEYLKGETGNIIGGDPYKMNHQLYEVLFQKDIRDKEKHKKCPNCGAPVMPYDLSCDYCLSVINNKEDWRISSIKRKSVVKT